MCSPKQTYNTERPEYHSLTGNNSSQRRKHKNKPINSTSRPSRDTIIKRIANPFGVNFQCRRLSQIRNHQTGIHNKCKSPLNGLSIVMSQVGEEGLDTSDGKENPAQDIEVLGSDEVVNGIAGIVSAENPSVVEGDVDCAGYQEGEEPETDDRGKCQGDIFCAELLHDEL